MTVDVLKRARLETAIWAAKLLLLCVGTVSTLVFFKAAIIPYLLNLTVSIVPQPWTSFKSCFFLSPLYIYIILNFIIITIAASSTFQRQNQNQNQKQHQQPSSSSSSSVAFSSFISDNAAKTADNIDSGSNYIYSPDNNSSIQSQSYSQQQQQQPTIQSHSKEDATALLFSPSSHDNRRHSNNEMMSCPDIHMVQADDDKQEAAAEDDDDEDQGFDPSPEMLFGDLMTESVEMRRPEVEVEVGEHINTLDTTWKAIMEGQGKAIGKPLKKSDTWDTPPRLTQLAPTRTKFKGVLEHQLQLHHSNLDGDDDDGGHGEDDAVRWARRELKKSDTFSDRVSLRREKSMTQEELNQRAEAFIKKFNNDIRLQRLESDQRRFKEIVNRGL